MVKVPIATRVVPCTPRPNLNWTVSEEAVRARAYELWLQNKRRCPEENWRLARAEFESAYGTSLERRQGF